METLIERASFMLELAGGSQTELAKIAGVSPPSVADWLNGKTKSIQIEPATKLADRFGLMPMWVSKGKLPKFLSLSKVASHILNRQPPMGGFFSPVIW